MRTILGVSAGVALALALASAGGAAWAGPPAEADTPSTTAAGTPFTLPKAWSVERKAAVTVISAPEADTHLAIVDIGPAKDASDAITRGWAAYRPDFKRPIKLLTPIPARNGWEERAVAAYETSPNEKAVLQGVALRKGAAWTVVLVDASEATAEKRGAAMNLISQTLRPIGYARESFAGKPARPLDPARVEAMKTFVKQSMDALGVPGASIALIEHGKVVYEGGIGVKELGKPEPVDAHTLYMIASNTKGMSTLLLAELVDEGKLRWDEKVTDVYPSFRLGSAATTDKVLVKHLVCACTGLPRKDLDWIFATRRDTPTSTTFTQLAATEPTSGFGEVFQYNNLMATAAGYIGGHIVHPDLELGAAYDRAMQEKIFDPLGMKDTTFDYARALSGNHASAHALNVDGKPAVAEMDFNYVIRPYRPAGGAWSSAHDMILYVQDEIAKGRLPNGQRLVSEQNLLERRKPNVPIGEDAAYGMGLEVDRTWGVTVVHHGGSMAGFKSDIMLVPDAEVGAVILTNSDEGQRLLRPFMRRLLEVLYDGKPEAAADVASAAERTQAAIKKERERLVIPPAADPVAGLAPHYTNPDLGEIKVVRDGPGVIFDVVAFKSHVASRKNDDGTVSFIAIDPAVDGFEYVVGAKAGKRTLTVRDGQHEYVFVEG